MVLVSFALATGSVPRSHSMKYRVQLNASVSRQAHSAFGADPVACYRPPRNNRFTAFASNESGSKCPPTEVTIWS